MYQWREKTHNFLNYRHNIFIEQFFSPFYLQNIRPELLLETCPKFFLSGWHLSLKPLQWNGISTCTMMHSATQTSFWELNDSRDKYFPSNNFQRPHTRVENDTITRYYICYVTESNSYMHNYVSVCGGGITFLTQESSKT